MKSVGGVAYLTPEEMSQVDESAIEEYGIDILSLMENAGQSTASMARRVLGGNLGGKCIACLIGKGNNGGDGLVAAKHLHNWGAEVTIVPGAKKEALEGVTAGQFAVSEKLGLRITTSEAELKEFDLLIDALLGYNAKGDPREPLASIIRRANSSGVPVLAVDIPSGLDPTSGEPGEPCIKAGTTLTFGFPKVGFLNPAAKSYIGQLYLTDISLPRQTYVERSMGDYFATNSVMKLW